MRLAVVVMASPPFAVSRSEGGMATPTREAASTTSSKGMGNSSPDSAICAPARATDAPVALRAMQGTSTSPATGSHTRPSSPCMAKDAACPTASLLDAQLPPSM